MRPRRLIAKLKGGGGGRRVDHMSQVVAIIPAAGLDAIAGQSAAGRDRKTAPSSMCGNRLAAASGWSA